MDDAFLEKTFDNVRSLYKLDSVSPKAQKKEALGPLPKASVILLSSLAAIWMMLIILFVVKVQRSHSRK